MKNANANEKMCQDITLGAKSDWADWTASSWHYNCSIVTAAVTVAVGVSICGLPLWAAYESSIKLIVSCVSVSGGCVAVAYA